MIKLCYRLNFYNSRSNLWSTLSGYPRDYNLYFCIFIKSKNEIPKSRNTPHGVHIPFQYLNRQILAPFKLFQIFINENNQIFNSNPPKIKKKIPI